jgi:pimeloyl-ACP methyl ester carboxylesterase
VQVPLVVFSHGIGGSRRGYSYLGQHWASNGIASLHLQHVGSDRNLWFGNPLGLVGRLQDAAHEREATQRPRDLRFALDQLLASPLGERIDAQRIVAAGHSYGANTTLLAAGACVEREGKAIVLRDERVRAAVLLSAPPFYGEREPSRILGPVHVPTLHVTATGDVIRIPGYYSGAEDRIAVFNAIGSRHKALAVFEGGSHSMFTDRPGTGGAELNPRVKLATKELSLAFLQASFGTGSPLALARWALRYREIVAKHDGVFGAA